MKKHILIFSALLLMAQLTIAATVTSPANIPAYYANANGKSGTNLYKALNTITNVGYTKLSYDGAITAYQKSDVYPTDPNHPDYIAGKGGQLWDMYGGCSFTLGDECGNYNDECDCYNREHSVPKSWWGGSKNNMYSDIFHLVPTDGYVNNRRSAYAFGEVQNTTYTYNGCKLGSSKSTITTDKETLLGTSATCSGTVFEPRDEYKGDFARGYLGMIAKYSNESYSITSGSGSMIFEAFKTTTHFGLTKYGIVLLMKWHREDPVSQKEIDRNNGIQATQGNRNPFIDYPYLAEYIWGEKNGQAIDMSKLMPSTDPDFVPGKSNGWRGEDTPPTPPTPPTPTVKYGVTWSANGEEVLTDSIEENQKITVLPQAPVSCSMESEDFVGWTTSPINGISEEAPAILYTIPLDFPAVTEDVTYYAVFARADVYGPSLPTTYIFDADHQDGWTNTAPNKGSYWLLETGTSIVSPEVDLMALDSIIVKMRTYGGTQYNQLTISEADGVLATITATAGKTMTEYKWGNNLYIAGISALTFSSNYGSGKGIGIQSILIKGTASATTYSRYITSCQGTTELQLTPNNDLPARKVLVGSQIYILLGDQLYNLQGQRVK